MRRKMLGVTLIELMIVVVVLAILASIAVPSYRRYLIRAQRTEATAALLQVQQAQEKFFLSNNRYASNAELTGNLPAGLGLMATTQYGNYNIDITGGGAGSPTAFVARAIPRAGQATDDSQCQTMTINEQGLRASTPGAPTVCFK